MPSSISRHRWVPGLILGAGCLVNGLLLGRKVMAMELLAPIDTVAQTELGFKGSEMRFAAETERVTGMSSYIYREYAPVGRDTFTVYVGYYDEQRQGKTIHSPKNCLPGQGWETVESTPTTFATARGPVTVNRYLVSQPGETALVYYWYQGRGRVEHDEFRVKYLLLRDAALLGRTEEALIRIIVPVRDETGAHADQIAKDIIPGLVVDVDRVLPPPK